MNATKEMEDYCSNLQTQCHEHITYLFERAKANGTAHKFDIESAKWSWLYMELTKMAFKNELQG